MATVFRSGVVASLALGVSLLVAAPVFVLPFRQSMEADRAYTLSNVKQLALGMLMYSTDWDDLLPYPADTKTAFAVMYP